ncbi:transposase [Streptomyces sp. NPDC094468]|uniref:transposase n=1 Tax=Streptomyces sp. NPDC094468 TaxID=3366066 RepID=UPI0038005D9A
MGSKYTKRYTEEFKRDAIALVDSSGKTVTAVARELGISSEVPARLVPPGQGGRGRGRAR